MLLRNSGHQSGKQEGGSAAFATGSCHVIIRGITQQMILRENDDNKTLIQILSGYKDSGIYNLDKQANEPSPCITRALLLVECYSILKFADR